MTVDFHTHVFPDKIAESTVRALESAGNTHAFSDGTVEGLLSEMERAGIDISVNLPVLTKPTQFESVLKFAVSVNERFSDASAERRIISFAGMHPDIENPEERLSEIVSAGIKGIKIHPDYQETFFDDERYVRILGEAKRLGLITVTHAGLDAAYVGSPVRCTPDRVLRLLDRIGGYDKLVLAHMGGSQFKREVYKKLLGKDVYIDTACVLEYFSKFQFKLFLRKHGADKILFATDSPWKSLSEYKKTVEDYRLRKNAANKIFTENAINLLNL